MVHAPAIYTLASKLDEPIYLQLVAQTRRLVAAGRLQAGDVLPSVRSVATAHGVNPMTVSKAYRLMVGQGILTRRAGSGMVVSQATIARAAELAPFMQRAATEAHKLGLSFEEAADQFLACWPGSVEGRDKPTPF